MLNETIQKHVYAANKQVLIKRRDWWSKLRKELRSEKSHTTTAVPGTWNICLKFHNVV